jgi:hypothetical protein
MENIKVGSLIVQKEGGFAITEKADIGVVTKIRNREEADRYVEIYWFRQKMFVNYLHFELGWFCGEDETSLWKIIP